MGKWLLAEPFGTMPMPLVFSLSGYHASALLSTVGLRF